MEQSVWHQFKQGQLPVSQREPAPKPKPIEAAPAGCCEFVRGLAFEGATGRLCVDGTFCPPSLFVDKNCYSDCPTRLKRLKDTQGGR